MKEQTNGGFISNVIKGICGAIIITLVGVLIFAGVIKTARLSSSVIKAVNQFIKIISIFLGVFFSVRNDKGLIKGALIGLISTAVIYLIFSLIGSDTDFSVTFIIDLVFGLIVGAISGVIAVNVKNR